MARLRMRGWPGRRDARKVAGPDLIEDDGAALTPAEYAKLPRTCATTRSHWISGEATAAPATALGTATAGPPDTLLAQAAYGRKPGGRSERRPAPSGIGIAALRSRHRRATRQDRDIGEAAAARRQAVWAGFASVSVRPRSQSRRRRRPQGQYRR